MMLSSQSLMEYSSFKGKKISPIFKESICTTENYEFFK